MLQFVYDKRGYLVEGGGRNSYLLTSIKKTENTNKKDK